MQLHDQFNPYEIEAMLGPLTLMAVDFGYIPLDIAELLLIHGLIEIQEEKLTAVNGKPTIEVFIPTPNAIDFIAKAKKGLPQALEAASMMSQFGSLPRHSKKKWVISQSYLHKWRSSGKRVLPKSIIRRWRPSISL